MNELTDEQPDELFWREEDWKTNPVLWFWAALVAFGFGTVGFALSLAARVNVVAVQFMTTLPFLAGLAAIARYRAVLSSPMQVAVGKEGIIIDYSRKQQRLDWDQIGWATVKPGTFNESKWLLLYDTQGQQVAKVGDAISAFDRLDELIQEYLSGRETDVADTIQLKNSRRSAFTTGGCALFLSLIVAGNIWLALEEKRTAKLFDEQAVPGVGEIVERKTAPNGVTRRLIYRVTNEAGVSEERNAEVTEEYWLQLEGETEVPVLYVPGEPAVSRLAEGEVPDDTNPLGPDGMLLLAAGLGLLCLVFFATAVMQWFGWDIDLDSKTKKISIKRYGTGR